MHPVSFVELPFAAKLATYFTPFILWVMFAEFVIDRQGWDVFLPFYQFGSFCPYDAAVLVAAAIPWAKAELAAKRQRDASSPQAKIPIGGCC